MKKRPTKAKKTAPQKPRPTAPAVDNRALVLPLSLIKPIKNIREKLEGIESLAESIRANGLLQPLVVSKQKGQFLLLAGERRFRALLLLKETHAPVRILNADEKEAKAIQVIENIQRQELTPIEEIKAVGGLLPFFSGNQSALARCLGKDQSYVNRCVRAAKLLSEVNYAETHTPLTKTLLFQLVDTENPKELWNKIQASNVKPARDKSGPVAGGRFVEGAIQYKDRGGAFSLRLNYDVARTPKETRTKILETLRSLIKRIEQE